MRNGGRVPCTGAASYRHGDTWPEVRHLHGRSWAWAVRKMKSVPYERFILYRAHLENNSDFLICYQIYLLNSEF